MLPMVSKRRIEELLSTVMLLRCYRRSPLRMFPPANPQEDEDSTVPSDGGSALLARPKPIETHSASEADVRAAFEAVLAALK